MSDPIYNQELPRFLKGRPISKYTGRDRQVLRAHIETERIEKHFFADQLFAEFPKENWPHPSQPSPQINREQSIKINDLPYELMVEIFKRVIESCENPTRELQILTKICKRFKSIIYGHPHELWRKIDLSDMWTFNNNEMQDIVTILSPNIDKSVCALKHLIVGFGFPPARPFPGLDPRGVQRFDKLKQLLHLSATTLESLKLYKQDLSYWTDVNLLDRIFEWLYHVGQALTRMKHLRVYGVYGKSEYSSALKHVIEEKRLANLITFSLNRCENIMSPSLCRTIGDPKLMENLRELDVLMYSDHVNVTFLGDIAPQLEVLRIGNATFDWHSELDNQIVRRKPFINLIELHVELFNANKHNNGIIYRHLAGGSPKLTTLCVKAFALPVIAIMESKSKIVKSLTMNDIDPLKRDKYRYIVQKWSKTLQVLSLSGIRDPVVVSKCLEKLYIYNKHHELITPRTGSPAGHSLHGDNRFHALTHLHLWDTYFWSFAEIVARIISKQIRLEELTIWPMWPVLKEEATTFSRTRQSSCGSFQALEEGVNEALKSGYFPL